MYFINYIDNMAISTILHTDIFIWKTILCFLKMKEELKGYLGACWASGYCYMDMGCQVITG